MNLYLARLKIAQNRIANLWLSNPYRIHQRLMMAYPSETRLLFRVEDSEPATILVQSHVVPDWDKAFSEFHVLEASPEYKSFDLNLQPGVQLRFRLLANPVVTRNGKRFGLLREEDQRAWLERKLKEAGATMLGYLVKPGRMVKSTKGASKDGAMQSHLAVWFEGILLVKDPEKLVEAVANGIGHAKGYGFGLLSLAPYQK